MYLSMSIYEGLTYVYIPFPLFNILFVLCRSVYIAQARRMIFGGTEDVEKWVMQGYAATVYISIA